MGGNTFSNLMIDPPVVFERPNFYFDHWPMTGTNDDDNTFECDQPLKWRKGSGTLFCLHKNKVVFTESCKDCAHNVKIRCCSSKEVDL